MPPKLKKGQAGKGKQKTAKEPERPSYLSDEAWRMSKDVPRLIEKLRGAVDKTPSGVTRAQAGPDHPCAILGAPTLCFLHLHWDSTAEQLNRMLRSCISPMMVTSISYEACSAIRAPTDSVKDT